MPRALQPCGTYPAYRRHLRNGETPCDLCSQAYRDYQNRRNGFGAGAGKSSNTSGASVPMVPGDLPTPRADALANLQLVTDAMTKAAPNAIPALSKRRQELVEYLNSLDAKEEGGLAKKLADARAARELRNRGTDAPGPVPAEEL